MWTRKTFSTDETLSSLSKGTMVENEKKEMFFAPLMIVKQSSPFRCSNYRFLPPAENRSLYAVSVHSVGFHLLYTDVRVEKERQISANKPSAGCPSAHSVVRSGQDSVVVDCSILSKFQSDQLPADRHSIERSRSDRHGAHRPCKSSCF